jgi:ubiquinone biosynthesis monooxygenase Coq7
MPHEPDPPHFPEALGPLESAEAGARPPPQHTCQSALPGEPGRKALLARMIRVDHAGEYGAKRIYEGQLAVLGQGRHGPTIRKMADQELEHLQAFEKLMVERRVRPSLIQPLWHVAGFALGAATALLGEKAAMACTVAVEEVIDGHYARQYAKLGEDEAPLKQTISKFRADELEHRETGLANGAEAAPGYTVLTTAIKLGTQAAIWAAERL